MKRGKKMPDARLADARLGAHSNDARYQTRRCQTWHALPGPFFRPSPPAVYLPLFLGYWLFHIENVQGQTPDKLLTSIFSHYPYGAGSKLRFDLLVIRNFFLPPPPVFRLALPIACKPRGGMIFNATNVSAGRNDPCLYYNSPPSPSLF